MSEQFLFHAEVFWCPSNFPCSCSCSCSSHMDHWTLLDDSDSVNMGDTASCSSGILNSGWNHRCPKQRQKVGVYNEVLCRLKELNVPEAVVPGFEDDLWSHFYRLPARHTKSSFLLLFYCLIVHTLFWFSFGGDHFWNLS